MSNSVLACHCRYRSSALRRRAAAVGVGATEMEAAGDMEDTKAAMIELILAREPPPDRVAGEAPAAAAHGASLVRASTASIRTSLFRAIAVRKPPVPWTLLCL